DTNDQTLQSAAVLSSSSASVTTDKIDYPPGDTVTISGKGWQPGETVAMVLHEEPTQKEKKLTAIADATGAFANTKYGPDKHDLGVAYTLTATGQTSGFVAQTTFTDHANGNFFVGPTSVLTNSTKTFALTFTDIDGSATGDSSDTARCLVATLTGFTSLTGVKVGTTEGQNWTVSASGNIITA